MNKRIFVDEPGSAWKEHHIVLSHHGWNYRRKDGSGHVYDHEAFPGHVMTVTGAGKFLHAGPGGSEIKSGRGFHPLADHLRAFHGLVKSGSGGKGWSPSPGASFSGGREYFRSYALPADYWAAPRRALKGESMPFKAVENKAPLAEDRGVEVYPGDAE